MKLFMPKCDILAILAKTPLRDWAKILNVFLAGATMKA